MRMLFSTRRDSLSVVRQHIEVTDVIEYVRRTTLNVTNLNTVHKREDRSRLYHIVKNVFATTKWKLRLGLAYEGKQPARRRKFCYVNL